MGWTTHLKCLYWNALFTFTTLFTVTISLKWRLKDVTDKHVWLTKIDCWRKVTVVKEKEGTEIFRRMNKWEREIKMWKFQEKHKRRFHLRTVSAWEVTCTQYRCTAGKYEGEDGQKWTFIQLKSRAHPRANWPQLDSRGGLSGEEGEKILVFSYCVALKKTQTSQPWGRHMCDKRI